MNAPRPDGGPPLSYGQQSLWFTHQVRGDTSTYHDRAVFRLTGPLDVPALCAAVDLVIGRHEVLRTRFVTTDGVPAAVADDHWRGRVRTVGAPEGCDRQAVFDAFVQVEADLPFDLAEGPLVRVSLLGFDDEDHVLALTTHRIVTDCWSSGLVLAQISECYADLAAGKEPRPAEPSVLYRDFAVWQHARPQQVEFEDLLAYWLDHVAGAPRELDLGGDPKSAGEVRRVETIEFRVPAAAVDGLRAFAQTCGATLYMALLAVFDVVIARAAGTDDVLVGVPVAGRTMIDFEESIGYFVNLLALRGDLRDDPTGTQLLGRVRTTVLTGMTYQDLPFELLARGAGAPAAAGGSHPLVQVTMQLVEGGAESGLRLPGVDVVPVQMDEYQIAFALTLNLYLSEEGLRGRLLHTRGEVDPRLAADVAAGFARLVELMPAHPQTAVSALPVPVPPAAAPTPGGRTSASGEG